MHLQFWTKSKNKLICKVRAQALEQVIEIAKRPLVFSLSTQFQANCTKALVQVPILKKTKIISKDTPFSRYVSIVNIRLFFLDRVLFFFWDAKSSSER